MGDVTRKRRFEEVRKADEDEMSYYRLVLARDLIKDYPDYSPAYIQYAIGLVEMARYEEARSALEEAIKHCPENKLHIPYSQLGYLYEAKGEVEKAVEWFKKCIMLKPQDADYHSNIGRILAKQGKFKEAEECYRIAIECPEGCVDEVYLNLGYVLRAQEMFTEALECFEKALELDPEYKAAQLALKDVKTVISYLES